MDDDSPGTFHAAPVWGRISVVAAGPIFNFIRVHFLKTDIFSSLCIVKDNAYEKITFCSGCGSDAGSLV